MKILGINVKELFELMITLAILGILWYLYNNLAGIIIFILSIIFLCLFYQGVINFINKYNYFNVRCRKNIGVGLIILSLLPGYLSLYMVINYDQSNKYLQEKSIGGIIEIGKFALSGRKFTVKNIMKVTEENIKNDLKDKVVIDTLNTLSGSSLSK